ncbi:MAG: proteasome subunit beta, partial [Acidimicrobiia bacterium]|nr:proteasome subunit beta [Acidimicrobiia bacterium]
MVPMFGPETDPGSSFVTLLRRVGIEPFAVDAAS